MSDFADNLVLQTAVDSLAFQERCRLRFINAALSVMSEQISFYASAAQSSGTTITFPSAPTGVVAGMQAHDVTNASAIPAFITVASVAGAVVTMSGTVTGVAINDQIVFTPAGLQYTTSLLRQRFAGAILTSGIDLKMLAMVILTNASNRTNCLANPSQPGGNIIDSDIDFTISSTFTGISSIGRW
jgi:hypothetical protein